MSMKTAVLRWAAFACCVGVWHSASATQPYQDYRKHMESAQTITALTDELMGDSVSLYSGATEFTATDIDLPGNNALPVQLRRRFSIEIVPTGSGNPGDPNYRGAGNWDVDVPYISTTWAQGAWENERCSNGFQPNVPAPLDVTDVWQGNTVHVPGAGDRKMLKLVWAQIPRPDSGTYKWSTRERDVFSCIPMQPGQVIGGQGFLMKTASGLHYYFDMATTRSAGTMSYKPGEGFPMQSLLGRTKVYLLASKIVDRFGNEVTFSYNTAGHPTHIESSDDRVIDLIYVNGRLSTATANGRTWTYAYGTTGADAAMLKTVQLPGTNGGTWQYAHTGTLYPDDGGVWEGSSNASCGIKPPAVTASFGITITHPSGAVGAFQFYNQRHPRSGVHMSACAQRLGQGSGSESGNTYYKLVIPNYFDVMTLESKTLSGPGLTARTWTYEYPFGSVALWGTRGQPAVYPCTTSCPVDKTVTVHEPDGTSKQYRYGYLYAANEGRLLGTTTLDENDVVRRTETTTYLPEPVDEWQQNFYPLYGQGFGPDDPSTLAVRPVIAHTIAQDGATFTMQVKTGTGCGGTGRYCFDIYGNPTQTTKSSSLGDSRDELTEYHNNTSLWILGQVSKTTVGGIVASETGYNTLAMPAWSKAFGKLQHTLAYETATGTQAGTLKTVTDGRNYVTTLTDWYRGIPRLIQHPATPDQPSGTTQSAVVDDNGWITSVTDENGYKTCYGYDPMGRLASITYPSEAPNVYGVCDTSTWAATTRTFLPYTAGPKYGIAAGHWQQTVSTGNARKITYFDALWRPLVEEAYDNSDAANTRSVSVKRYDAGGRLAFQSYPLRTLSNYATVTAGTATEYDAIDRPTLVRQTSELGNLDTTTQYLSGFKTRVTLPKHQGANPAVYTETTYQAWDQPSTELPETIAQPEGALTTIARDAFGKPTAITRSGGGLSLTRRYVYNAAQELCKSIEPETGSTVLHYDAAGNLDWSAAGLALPGTTSCDDTHGSIAARKVSRSYDQRNRLKTLRFLADTRGDQDWFYTPDGLPSKVVTVNVPGAVHPENHYVYNKRRLLTTETQHLPAWYSYSLGYTYDANGSLKRINYPSSDYVDFAPNALGQARQVTGPHTSTPGATMTYASQVTYHPNGSVAGFTYGNDIVYQMRYPTDPNARPLPEVVDSVGVQRYVYRYDGNGNPTHIHDQTRGGDYSRLLQYDGLDRLTGAGSVSFGGDDWHRFTYDALDNLVTWKHGGVKDHRYCYNAANQLEFVRTGAFACSGVGAGSATDYFHYDVQGNVDVHDDHGFDFDTGNRLREVIDVERYRYDAHGRRVLAMNFASGTITSQYGHNGQLLYQKNARTGQEKQLDHIYLAGSLIAQREQPLAGGTATVKYLHTDALGSPVAVTNQAGTVVERMEYEPYGKQMASTATIGQDRPGYTGHVRDTATGMLYAQQRYLHQDHPVFLSVDPVTALSSPVGQFNRYRYANNNPYKFTDPDGRVGIVTKRKDGSYHIAIPTRFSGPGALKSGVVDGIKADVANRLSGTYEIGGKEVKVDVEVTDVTSSTPKRAINNITLTDGPTSHKDGKSFVTGGLFTGMNTGEWDNTSRGWFLGQPAHEAMHLIGADDKYDLTRGLSFPGEEFNLMGQYLDPFGNQNRVSSGSMGEALSSRHNIQKEE